MAPIEPNWALCDFFTNSTCRVVTSNPVVGFGGGMVGQVLLEENGHTIHHGFTQDGQYNVNSDGVYTLAVGGQIDSGTSLNLIASQGDASVTANNGNIKLRGQKIFIDACDELVFKCAGNVRFEGKDSGVCNSIYFKTITLATNAELGNLVPRKVTFGGQCFANTAVGGLAQQSAFVAGALKEKAPEIKKNLEALSGDLQGQLGGLQDQLGGQLSGLQDQLGGQLSGLQDQLGGQLGGLQDQLGGQLGGLQGQLGDSIKSSGLQNALSNFGGFT